MFIKKILKAVKTITITFFMVVLSFAFVEAMLRVKNASMKNYDIEMWKYANTLKKKSDNALLGHEHQANKESLLQSIKMRTNAYGCRGCEISLKKPAHIKRRILFLGSSITLGWGVAEEETVSEKVKQMFIEKNNPVEVINGGIGNYNAERYIELFLTKLQQLKPTDIVIHGFVRDAEPLEFKEGNFFLKHSQLAVTLWSSYHRLLDKKGETSLIGHYQRYYDPNSASFQRMRDAFLKLAKYAKENNINIYFAMTPDMHNLKNYPLQFAHDRMEGIAKDCGFSYVDLLPVFAEMDPKDIWVMPGDPHPSSKGHSQMAKKIYALLERNKELQRE